MLATIVNVVYLGIIVLYAFPVAATLVLPELEVNGLIDELPTWMFDTSWRGFWLSPFRMVKEIRA